MATISKDIKLYYKQGEGEFTKLDGLQEIPEIGGEAEALEITTLDDAAHMFTNGILNYGDSLGFVFLYEKEQYLALHHMEESVEWKVELPDGATATFSGACSVKLAGVGVNAVLTYTLSIKPDSAISWA